MNLGAKQNDVFRYSGSGLLPKTDAWKKTLTMAQRSGKNVQSLIERVFCGKRPHGLQGVLQSSL